MDFNRTIDIILKDLSEVREIVDDLKNYPGVPVLQVELARSKCKSAEEIIALLKTIKPAETEKNLSPEKVVSDTNRTIDKKMNKPLEPEPQTSRDENLMEIAEEVRQEEIPFQIQVPYPDKKSDAAILADQFTGGPNTVLDQFGNISKEDDISSVIKTKPVEKLADAIGVNDKFLFIREIFSGSKPLYNEAISKLEKAENFPDARAIIMSYAGEENDVVLQLLDIVKRKLPSDG